MHYVLTDIAVSKFSYQKQNLFIDQLYLQGTEPTQQNTIYFPGFYIEQNMVGIMNTFFYIL